MDELISSASIRQQTHYEVLGVTPSASDLHIREAYFRLKNTYVGTNQALYSLVDNDDIDALMRQIEHAYETLLNPEARKAYNAMHDIIGAVEPDQILERVGATKRLLPDSFSGASFKKDFATSFTPQKPCATRKSSTTVNKPGGVNGRIMRFVAVDDLGVYAELLQQRIDAAQEPFDGAFLKSLREVSGVSLEDFQFHTKIPVSFIRMLESDDFSSLPQISYLKGFLNIYLAFIRVKNHKEITEQYLRKFEAWKMEQS